MRNKNFRVSTIFSDAKFVLSSALAILLFGLTLFFNCPLVSAQIAGENPVQKNFFEPDFVKNSGETDTSFKVNLLSDFDSVGSVTALVKQPDGKILVAGSFTNVGGITKRTLVRLNPDLSVDNSFDVGLGAYSIFTLAVQPDGKILVGGSFSNFNSISRNGIVRLNADGSIDSSFEVSIPYGYGGIQKIILLPGGKILIAGNFSNIGDVLYPGIAVLEADGNLDQNFNPAFISSNGSTPNINTAVVQPDGKILIAGNFTNIGGYTRNRVARLESSGVLDLSFDAGIGPNGQVYEIVPTTDGKILIGGDFTSVNGVVRGKIARLNSSGSVDGTFNFVSPSDITVRTMILQPDGKIVVGTDSSYYSQGTFPVVFRLNTDGSVDSTFTAPVGNGNAGINGSVKGLLLESGGKIIIGGLFSTVGNMNRRGLARLNANGTLDTSLQVLFGSSGTVTVITPQSDGKILIGGNFSYVNGVAKNRLARLNQDGSVDSSFNPTLVQGSYSSTTFITAMIVQPDGKILIGGNIATGINGTTNNGLFRLNADGTTDSSFSATLNGLVQSIVLQPDGKILLGGNFYQINGTDHRYIGRINADGSVDAGFNVGTGPNSTIVNLALQNDGKIVAAGNFDSFNGTQHRGLVRLNSAGSVDASFNAEVSNYGSSIFALAVQPDGKVLIGGNFYQVNGVTRNRLARLNADGSLDTAFRTTVGQEGNVNTIILQPDGKILVAGNFNNIFGAVRRKVARLFSDGTVDTVFNPGSGPDGEVFALARQSNGKVLIGGNFSVVDGVSRTGIARLRSNACVVSPLYDFDGDGKTDISVYRPNGGAWYRSNTTDNKYYQQLFGLPSDLIVPGDYDGDGKTDIAVFRPSEGVWYLLNSRVGFQAFQFGARGDKPLAADFDGDGKDDLAVFRPSNGTWYIRRSSLGFTAVTFGASEDIPVIADMDGDCQADVAVFRPSNGTWYWLQSSDGSFRAVQFGADGDIPTAGDYDGDGKTDPSVYRPSNGTWYLLKSMEGFSARQFGISTDRPVPADYDGDGKTDIAVFRNGTWYMTQSLDGKIKSVQFGENNDQPIPAAYLSR